MQRRLTGLNGCSVFGETTSEFTLVRFGMLDKKWPLRGGTERPCGSWIRRFGEGKPKHVGSLGGTLPPLYEATRNTIPEPGQQKIIPTDSSAIHVRGEIFGHRK